MLTFDANHYVPILKTKQGERWALASLLPSRRSHVTPLLEIHAHRTLSATEHAAQICESLVVDWGTSDHFFIDTRWLHPEAGDPAVISGVMESVRDSGLLAIPIATIQYDAVSREQLAGDLDIDGPECAIRIRPSDLPNSQALLELVNDLGTTTQACHLILDYRSTPMNLAFDIARVPNLAEWRTLTVASGSFPRSLSERPLNQWFVLPRLEWNAWIESLNTGNLARMPAFGDYTTRDSGAPANGGKPSVNIRYTRATDWLCRMGGRLEDGAAPQMKEFCSLLVSHTSYSGQQFSAGDAEYYDKSLPTTGTGGSGDWAKWPISHHIAFVADQIAAGFGA